LEEGWPSHQYEKKKRTEKEETRRGLDKEKQEDGVFQKAIFKKSNRKPSQVRARKSKEKKGEGGRFYPWGTKLPKRGEEGKGKKNERESETRHGEGV